jgi:hypothetical protein
MFLRRVKLRGQQMELLAGYQALLVGATKNPRDFTVPNVVREFQNHFCHGAPFKSCLVVWRMAIA